MARFNRFCKFLAVPLIFTLIIGTFPVAFAAPNVSTDELLEQTRLDADREMIIDLMSRDEMKNQMQLLGVNADEAMARVNTMSDSEIKHLAAEIRTTPAGGDALGTILGAAVTIFVVLLITDILCLTSFFNFTRCVR